MISPREKRNYLLALYLNSVNGSGLAVNLNLREWFMGPSPKYNPNSIKSAYTFWPLAGSN